MASPGDPWTAHERATLERLAAAGKSAKEAMAELPGRTRNAVIGEAHRHGIRFAGSKSMTIKRAPKKRVRVRQRRVPTAPTFRVAQPKQPRPLCFSDDPASRVAAALFAASDAAQRRRDGWRGRTL